MKNYQSQTQYFKALMHPTRMAILDTLREGEQCVWHMEAAFGLRQAHISQHLMVLRDAGLAAKPARAKRWMSQPAVLPEGHYLAVDGGFGLGRGGTTRAWLIDLGRQQSLTLDLPTPGQVLQFLP